MAVAVIVGFKDGKISHEHIYWHIYWDVREGSWCQGRLRIESVRRFLRLLFPVCAFAATRMLPSSIRSVVRRITDWQMTYNGLANYVR
jgi:hypothetical protein